MILIGRSIRWYNNFDVEVRFSRENKFDFLQIWFRDGSILVGGLPEPKEEYIKSCGFPVIIHAVLDISDFDMYGDDLISLLQYLGHEEVIIHPVCKKEPILENTQRRLVEKVKAFSYKARGGGIVFYLENNSIIDGFHCKKEELQIVYENDDYVEQLLDIAHISDYEHLEQIISVKFPKCLHAAGKHFNVPHEHLPIAQGDIDYNLAFQQYLRGFDGRIILEVDGNDDEILSSKRIIEEAVHLLK